MSYEKLTCSMMTISSFKVAVMKVNFHDSNLWVSKIRKRILLTHDDKQGIVNCFEFIVLNHSTAQMEFCSPVWRTILPFWMESSALGCFLWREMVIKNETYPVFNVHLRGYFSSVYQLLSDLQLIIYLPASNINPPGTITLVGDFYVEWMGGGKVFLCILAII